MSQSSRPPLTSLCKTLRTGASAPRSWGRWWGCWVRTPRQRSCRRWLTRWTKTVNQSEQTPPATLSWLITDLFVAAEQPAVPSLGISVEYRLKPRDLTLNDKQSFYTRQRLSGWNKGKSQVEFPRRCSDSKSAQDHLIRTSLKGQFNIVLLYNKFGFTGYNIVRMVIKWWSSWILPVCRERYGGLWRVPCHDGEVHEGWQQGEIRGRAGGALSHVRQVSFLLNAHQGVTTFTKFTCENPRASRPNVQTKHLPLRFLHYV